MYYTLYSDLNNIGDQVWKCFIHFNLFSIFFDFFFLGLQFMRNAHNFRFHYLKKKTNVQSDHISHLKNFFFKNECNYSKSIFRIKICLLKRWEYRCKLITIPLCYYTWTQAILIFSSQILMQLDVNESYDADTYK